MKTRIRRSAKQPLSAILRTIALIGVAAGALACSGGTVEPTPDAICAPSCRAGFVCSDGQCVSACNPPCSDTQTCVSNQCVDSSVVKKYDYDDSSTPPEFVATGQLWPTTELRYYIEDFTPDLPQGSAVSAVQGAFDRWHSVCNALTFTRVFDPASADIVIRWASGEHGDGSPFDGNGAVLAHAYYPGSGIGGDTHFDEDEVWGATATAATISLPAVALHEFGHALGLGHSADSGAIMYPYYRPEVMELGPDDVIGITTIYNCAGANPQMCGDGTVSGGEQCDGANLNGATCDDLGFAGGTLSCNKASCAFDTSGCNTTVCDNGIKEPGEQCDGNQLGGATCQSLGFTGGSLSCTPGTCTYNTGGCTNVSCGNGNKEAGEQCDGNQLGGATCQSLGFTGGSLSCAPGTCTYNSSACCNDACSFGSSACMNGQVMACGNYDADACLEYGNAQACINGQTCVGTTCGCGGGNNGQFTVTDYVYPNFGPAGCSGDNLGKLKASAAMVNSGTLRIYVRKSDNSAFTTSGTLSLYVGNGPTCLNPPNMVKMTKPITLGITEQTIDLNVGSYNGAWLYNELKTFWVGKDEGGIQSYRASGTFLVQRTCIP